ncbi:N-acetylglucosamine-6-phosphate deacetylase [Rossellomorea vietnamensis]|uniref:N-acetylglucosamine-6-phosphate deacetylase n=1 Tax=Rossellomorea aquimaris TaxID=189382 RepID=A0A5D4TM45_9BACI|nr:N-acetylglucosamine-6-phosphate deacetylase [Rossellomorea aquimaris]TYS76315.1 N-acetylglucosamine-6-phosphate deacetylase [Rossellomorea aquimaris]
MTSHKPILLRGMQIYSGDSKLEKGYIKMKDHKIVDIGPEEELTGAEGYEILDFPSGSKAVPGFIDVHIHGVNGADVMDATEEALDNMARTLPQEGTTSFLATTITQSRNEIEKALKNAGSYIHRQKNNGQSEIIGIHLEGPFVNEKKAGAQPKEHITDPDVDVFKKWQSLSQNSIKLVTLAVEQSGGLEMVRYLRDNGVIASIGHSDAAYEEVGEAIEAGANHVTHLFNQMRGLHHREPGVVGAAFLRDELKAEIIADGIHVRPEMIKLAYREKGEKGIILITDSMRAKCLKNGQYDLGGQEVIVQDGKAVLEDGTLAGSILKMSNAVKNMMAYTGCELHEVIEMASVNPAKQLNIFDRKGSIKKGRDADIVILDDKMDILMTFCRGTIAFKEEEN